MQVRFDDFMLDTETRQLRHGDAERHLSPKAFELLRVLVENRPRALSKAELHEQDSLVFVVDEYSANQCV